MDGEPQARSRRRGIRIVRLATAGAAAGALSLAWGFGQLAEAYFSGKPATPAPPPVIPKEATPVQKPPPVVVSVVHHSGPPPGGAGAPRPPSQPPGAAPAPPPPPVCHSTPSKPC
jgi:hypothetical protein